MACASCAADGADCESVFHNYILCATATQACGSIPAGQDALTVFGQNLDGECLVEHIGPDGLTVGPEACPVEPLNATSTYCGSAGDIPKLDEFRTIATLFLCLQIFFLLSAS